MGHKLLSSKQIFADCFAFLRQKLFLKVIITEVMCSLKISIIRKDLNLKANVPQPTLCHLPALSLHFPSNILFECGASQVWNFSPFFFSLKSRRQVHSQEGTVVLLEPWQPVCPWLLFALSLEGLQCSVSWRPGAVA